MIDQQTVLQALRAQPAWRDATDTTVRALAAAARVEDRAAGQMFVVEGQPASAVYFLVDGAARTFYPARKARPEMTVRLMRAPATFGDLACATGAPYAASVEAIGPARAVAVDARTFLDALRRDAAASFALYLDIARRFAGAVGNERAALSSTPVERTVALLLAWAEHEGTDVVRLSQDDIAQQIGSNRRSVVRVMEQLYQSGGLERRGRRYAIVDRNALLSAATGELPRLR